MIRNTLSDTDDLKGPADHMSIVRHGVLSAPVLVATEIFEDNLLRSAEEHEIAEQILVALDGQIQAAIRKQFPAIKFIA